ncbi:MAG TPA: hypothetical protein VFI24_27160 [Pyrinomonadaceae bacterium]|nr:hypothetical protein [Pyrinomonadaceae bacterium]
MKTRYLPLAGLFIIGILGASGSIAAAATIQSISGADIAENAQIAEISDESLIAIGHIINYDIKPGLIDTEIPEIAA